MKYALLAIAIIVSHLLFANVYQNSLYIKTTPDLLEIRAQEEAEIREEERKRRAEEEREIDRIGIEMAKLGQSFVGGRPRSVSEANEQYSRAISESQRAERSKSESRYRQALQDERFRNKMAERRRIVRSRTFGTQAVLETGGEVTTTHFGTAEAGQTNYCAVCMNSGFVYDVPCAGCENGIEERKCENCWAKTRYSKNGQDVYKRIVTKCNVCNATRLVPNRDGLGCSPCTNCIDGYVQCSKCNGKGVLPGQCRSCEGTGVVKKAVCPHCNGRYATQK